MKWCVRKLNPRLPRHQQGETTNQRLCSEPAGGGSVAQPVGREKAGTGRKSLQTQHAVIMGRSSDPPTDKEMSGAAGGLRVWTSHQSGSPGIQLPHPIEGLIPEAWMGFWNQEATSAP